MRTTISDHVFEVQAGRLRILARSRLRTSVVADVTTDEIVEIELGQTRKAGAKREHTRFGRAIYRPFSGRTGLRLVYVDGEAEYLDLPGTPAEIADAIGPVLDEVERNGGTVLW